MKELIEKLEDAKATLIADNYKTWSYVIIAIDEAIQAMHDFANADKKQHAIGFNEYLIKNGYSYWDDGNFLQQWMDKDENDVDINEVYNEYLNTLNNPDKV